MNPGNLNIGFAITGSFCTIKNSIKEVQNLINEGFNVYPIISESVKNIDTRFYRSTDLILELENMTGRKVISTIKDAEPIGPQNLLDVLVVAPCTGNTIAKIANGINDTPVTMACKAHLRNQKPVVIAISTNDGLGINARNIGALMSIKNVFIVPFKQDSYRDKPNSIISESSLIIETIKEALDGKQMQPVII